MRPSEFDSMDDFIDAALRSEPARVAPIHLQRAVQLGVERIAQARRERRRFVTRASAAALVFAAAAFALIFGAVTAGLGDAFRDFVPGAMGYYDAMRIAAADWAAPALVMAAVGACAVVAAGILTEGRVRRRTARA